MFSYVQSFKISEIHDGDRVSVWDDGKVPETDGGVGCTAVRLHATEFYTKKWLKGELCYV